MEFIALFNYGVLGIAVFALGWYIIFLHKQQKEENKLDREERKLSREERDRSMDKMTTAINNNTNVIVGLQSLLESLDRRVK